MKEIFAKRLKSARTQVGLSQDELVNRIGGMISKNAISKYEKGEMMADGKVIIAIAKALNVKTDYFFRPFTVEIENIEFRKKKKLPVKQVNAIKQKVTDIVERYLEVEQFLSIESRFKNPISNIQISSKRDVEHAVNVLLKSWKLGYNALPNVIELLEDKEIKVVEIEAPEEFDGFSGWADGKYPIIVVNKTYGIERKRLTALHELGHLLLNFLSNIDQKEMEKMCFQFGAAMLMPEETFKNEIGHHRSHIPAAELVLIKETYGISIQAIMQRAKDLGIINEFTFLNFRKRINNNRKEVGLGEYIGKEESNRFKQLVFRAAAEEIISMSKAANLFNQKLASFRKEFVAL
jgi:Zn-dependent peptidase ImmA (M78 family)/DNA-binding XRE family transcriptional regulator